MPRVLPVTLIFHRHKPIRVYLLSLIRAFILSFIHQSIHSKVTTLFTYRRRKLPSVLRWISQMKIWVASQPWIGGGGGRGIPSNDNAYDKNLFLPCNFLFHPSYTLLLFLWCNLGMEIFCDQYILCESLVNLLVKAKLIYLSMFNLSVCCCLIWRHRSIFPVRMQWSDINIQNVHSGFM
jgi:hypothetical protein